MDKGTEDQLLNQLLEAAEEVEMIEAAAARHINAARAQRDKLLIAAVTDGISQTKAARAAHVSRTWVYHLLQGNLPGRRKTDKFIGG